MIRSAKTNHRRGEGIMWKIVLSRIKPGDTTLTEGKLEEYEFELYCGCCLSIGKYFTILNKKRVSIAAV